MQLKELSAAIPVLNKTARFESLAGGNINRTWKVMTDEEVLVLRADGPLVRTLGLDRSIELKALAAASASGLAPEVIWTDAPRGLMLTRFTDGPAWDFAQPDAHEALAAALVKLHALPADLPAVNFAECAHRYAAALGHNEAMQLADDCESLFRQWCSDTDRYVFCHNDLGPGNILATSGGLIFIDWEYAGLAEPCFELAVISTAFDLDEEQTSRLLTATGRADEAPRVAGCRALYERLATLWLMLACSAQDAPVAYRSALSRLRAGLNP